MYNSLSSQICSSSCARKTSTGYVWLTIIISDIFLVRDKSIYKILRRKSCFDAGLWGTGFESCVLILSCSLARHFNLVTPLPTEERKWVLVNRLGKLHEILPGYPRRLTANPGEAGRHLTPVILQKQRYALVVESHEARKNKPKLKRRLNSSSTFPLLSSTSAKRPIM